MIGNRLKWFGRIIKKDKLKKVTVVMQIKIKKKGIEKTKKEIVGCEDYRRVQMIWEIVLSRVLDQVVDLRQLGKSWRTSRRQFYNIFVRPYLK